MDQKKLHKTVEAIASQKFSNESEMIESVLNQIIELEDIKVTGGRIWKLDSVQSEYVLMYQTGSLDKIDKHFRVKISDYPLFDLIAKERTVLGDETNIFLRGIGIMQYSASGVGSKTRINGKQYYEYLIALNSENINEDLRLTLNIIATALTSQINQIRYSLRANSLKADIDKARELQKSILPEHEYRFSNYVLFGLTDPAEIVGGDFFDYLEIGGESNILGVTVGDAASKGVSAAAEAMYISGALRMACNFEIKMAVLMKRMNSLVNKIFEDDKFASLFYGELSVDQGGLFLYANAGHNPPMFIKSNTDEIKYLYPTGPVLGPTPNAKYLIENINFDMNDVLLIFSDGVVDSTNAEFESFGEERISSILKSNKHLTPREIVYKILDALIVFSKNGSYSDDKTLVAIKRVS